MLSQTKDGGEAPSSGRRGSCAAALTSARSSNDPALVQPTSGVIKEDSYFLLEVNGHDARKKGSCGVVSKAIM